MKGKNDVTVLGGRQGGAHLTRTYIISSYSCMREKTTWDNLQAGDFVVGCRVFIEGELVGTDLDDLDETYEISIKGNTYPVWLSEEAMQRAKICSRLIEKE